MKTGVFVVLVIIAALVGAITVIQGRGGHRTAAKAGEVVIIQADLLKSWLDEKKPLMVLDVREPDEYAEGHIPGAVLLPLGRIERGDFELPADVPLVIVCRSGRRSAIAAKILIGKGYSEVYDLAGGMLAWPYEVVK